MTIALGFTGNKGVVLATDSQETVSGYIKGRKGKITTTIFPHSTLCFAGSGFSDYIETAIEKAIVGIDTKKNFSDIVSGLEKNLLNFFDDHLARWAYFPENDRPTVELLIGITAKKGPFGLYHYSGTAFHRVSQKAIGAGLLLAHNLMARFDPAIVNASVSTMAVCAIYILAQVKEQVDACGGFTDLVALRKNGDFALTDTPQIESLETEIEAIERASIAALAQKLAAKSAPLIWMGDTLRKAKPSDFQKSGGPQ